jgi:hypothetical protein
MRWVLFWIVAFFFLGAIFDGPPRPREEHPRADDWWCYGSFAIDAKRNGDPSCVPQTNIERRRSKWD